MGHRIDSLRRAMWVPTAAVCAALPAMLGAQSPGTRSRVDTAGEGHAAEVATTVMAGAMAANAHLRMTPIRPASGVDSARAAALAGDMRSALTKYRDVRQAQADGFRQFLPHVKQPIYHFTNWRWALQEMFRFDPAKPTSLLYRQEADGSFTLVGAMYAARREASLEELDQRIPLSMVQWHQHVNWCVPKRSEEARWRETRNGAPVFGPLSPVATQRECDEVGGRFLPHIFGWMVHANVFAGDDPAVIWGGEGHRHGKHE